jgi:hypothetical protein
MLKVQSFGLASDDLAWNHGQFNQPLKAQTYVQPHCGNGVFGNVYLSCGEHYEVNIAGTTLL